MGSQLTPKRRRSIILALIGWIIKKLKEGASNILLLLTKGVGAILLGGIEYLIVWEIGLWC